MLKFMIPLCYKLEERAMHMKVCGIVAEYNPFHNGHKYQIEQIRKETNADVIIAVMSGNFMQRGVPASFDKWARTKMALDGGVDMVIELPTIYSLSSAEFFASGAVSILNSLNCVDYISFGAKTDDLAFLKDIATFLNNEPADYKDALQKELKKGVSYPAARSKCIKQFFDTKYDSKIIEETLLDSNNILAIEYLKALEKLDSKIQPIIVKRIGTDYNSLEINGDYCSSTAIREILKDQNVLRLKDVIPNSSYNTISEEINMGKMPMELSNFEELILYKLRNSSLFKLSQIADVKEGLENVISKSLLNSFDLESLIISIKSKRYTRTRIQRILLNSLLGINEEFIETYKFKPQYARILGFSKKGRNALALLNKYSKIPVITSLNNFTKKANHNQLEMLKYDIDATNIYTLGYKLSNLRKYNLDYTTKIVER